MYVEVETPSACAPRATAGGGQRAARREYTNETRFSSLKYIVEAEPRACARAGGGPRARGAGRGAGGGGRGSARELAVERVVQRVAREAHELRVLLLEGAERRELFELARRVGAGGVLG